MPASLKFALRSLRRTPGFTLLAVLILTLGIGTTTAMFTVTRTVLLKPLAYREPQRLVTVLFRVPQLAKQLSSLPANPPHYKLWRDHARTLEEVGLIGPASNILSGRGESVQVGGAQVTPNIFGVLGVQPVLGRAFMAEEGQAGRAQVVIVSDSFWREKLGGRPDVLGQQIRLSGKPFQVIGVMRAGFPFPRGREMSDVGVLPDRIDYWVPLVFDKDDFKFPLANFNFVALARIRSGVTMRQAQAEMSALERVIAKTFPEPVEIDPVVRPLQQMMARDVRSPLLLLMSAVGVVLLIVCINLMNLVMVRATAQSRDRAIRVAVGASARDLMGAALTESLLLALTGGVLGTLLAKGLLTLLRLHAPAGLPRVDEVGLDLEALGFAFVLSVGTAILFGAWPAWRGAQADPQQALHASGRSATEGREGRRAGKMLVLLEVALSTILLLSAGLLLRSFATIMSVDPGLDVQRLLTAAIDLPPEKYKEGRDVHSFYRRVQEEVAALPGVSSAGLVSSLPLTGESDQNPAAAGDRAIPPVVECPLTVLRWASASYFKTTGIPMKAGGTFEQRDQALQAVISDKLAARLWPGASAIGRPLKLYGSDKLLRITGVVGSVHAGSLTVQPAMTVYLPDWQETLRNMSLVVRTRNEPSSLSSAIRRTVNRLEPEAAIQSMNTMEEVEAASVAPQRFQMILLVVFAAAALILACLGIYAVLSFATGRRTSEIGIRMAMGARPGQILQMTLQSGLSPVLLGIALGLFVSAGLGRLIQDVLFGVQALDPLMYISVALTLLAAAGLACWIPARRAARLSPIEALRHT